jgi:hypothetical protein
VGLVTQIAIALYGMKKPADAGFFTGLPAALEIYKKYASSPY